MAYNIDFLLASLVFLLIILYNFMENKSLYFSNNRTFLWVIGIGFIDIIFDLICTLLITLQKPDYRTILEICLAALYMLHITVPIVFLNHILSHFKLSRNEKLIRCIFCILVPLAAVGFVISNHWNYFLFNIDANGIYSRGPFYIFIYIVSGIYLLLTVLFSLLHYRSLGRTNMRTIIELVLLAGITVLIQFMYKDILLFCFGITQVITVLFLTLNNPYNYTDSLTSTFDIRYFHDRCTQKLEHKKAFNLILIKLTQLSRINFVLGTSIGNELLRKTSKILRLCDKHNFVFRISGSQFAVMTSTKEQYTSAIEKISKFFSEPIDLKKETIDATPIICGIENAHTIGDSDTLLAYMEYLAASVPVKEGRTCLFYADDKTLNGFHYNQEVESFLDTAIQKNLFDVVYQPIYSISQKRFIGAEALSRLTHPTLGPIPPDLFIRIAEQHGYIIDIGMQQLRKICSFVQQNPKLIETLESISINLSPVELMKPGHIEKLIGIIREYNIPTSFIHFEITETVATEYNRNLSSITQKINDNGIGLCLDDFGSGYANLSSVLKLPFNIIKLDRSLLANIENDKRLFSLYGTTIHALRAIGFSVTAEGVETKKEFDFVTSCGADCIQGYYLSHPLKSDEFLRSVFTEADNPTESETVAEIAASKTDEQ